MSVGESDEWKCFHRHAFIRTSTPSRTMREIVACWDRAKRFSFAFSSAVIRTLTVTFLVLLMSLCVDPASVGTLCPQLFRFIFGAVFSHPSRASGPVLLRARRAVVPSDRWISALAALASGHIRVGPLFLAGHGSIVLKDLIQSTASAWLLNQHHSILPMHLTEPRHCLSSEHRKPNSSL